MPTGGPPPSLGGQKNTTSLEDIDKAIDSLNREGLHAQEKATKLLELEHAKEVLKQQYVRSAAVVTGQLQPGPNADIRINTGSSASADAEKERARQIQSAVAVAAAAVNLLWLTYFGEDAPAEVFAAIAVLIPAAAQVGTALVLNRKGN